MLSLTRSSDFTTTYLLFRTPLIIQHSLIGSKENWKTVSKVIVDLFSYEVLVKKDFQVQGKFHRQTTIILIESSF